jgi:hypothetical protein
VRRREGNAWWSGVLILFVGIIFFVLYYSPVRHPYYQSRGFR